MSTVAFMCVIDCPKVRDGGIFNLLGYLKLLLPLLRNKKSSYFYVEFHIFTRNWVVYFYQFMLILFPKYVFIGRQLKTGFFHDARKYFLKGWLCA